MFFLDKTAIEIAKMASKPLDVDEKNNNALVFITPDGVIKYTNGYYCVSYQLPKELPEDSPQMALFESSSIYKESYLSKSVALIGKELAHICDFKSEIPDVGEYAIIRDSAKDGFVDIYWDSGVAENTTKHKVVDINADDMVYTLEKAEDIIVPNGSKLLMDSTFLKELSAIALKICKTIDERDIMVTIDNNASKYQLTADRMCITIMAIKKDEE